VAVLELKSDVATTGSSMSPIYYAISIGVDVGPKLTPIGSLATLLWLDLLSQAGIKVGWLEYIRRSWIVTLLVLMLATFGLFITYRI
ncbi:MAG: ArsB/NhaD family transporter, partial [Blastocatellia bacterium]